MNFKTTALLLLLLLGSAGLYLGTRTGPGGPSLPAATGPEPHQPLVTGTTFRRLVIERTGDDGATTRAAYQLRDGRWWQTQPVRFPVEAAGPESVINAALSLVPRQQQTPRPPDGPVVDAVPTRADLGLERPAQRVVIVGGDEVFSLALGRREVAGTAWLAADGDDTAFLVDATLHDAVDAADAAGWRPTRLPGPAADSVATLTLAQRDRPADQNAVLHRGPAGWRWGPPPARGARANANARTAARADRAAANRLAAIADGLPIAGYVTDDPDRLAQLGLAHPAATLTLRRAALSAAPSSGLAPGTSSTPPSAFTLRLGRPADAGQPPARYATATFARPRSSQDANPHANPAPDGSAQASAAPSSVVFLIPGSAAAPLLADPVTLRDPRLVIADPATVTGLRVDRVDAGTVELAAAAAGPRFVEPHADARADPGWADAWLTLLHRTRARAFTSAPPEAQAPIATATLRLSADRVERVRLYRDRDGRHGPGDALLVVREDEPVAAVVPAETLAPLLAPAITLRDTALPQPRGVDTVRLTRDDGVVFAFSGLDRDAPRLAVNARDLPATERWDVAAARRLRDWLQAPRAVQWTPRVGLPRGPVARLSAGPDDPAYTVNVGQNLAQRTDLPGVFRIAPDIAALFNAEYRPRLLIDARADELTAVGLQRRASESTPADEPAALRDRLAGLRAERWPPDSSADPAPADWSLRIAAGPRQWTLERGGPTGWRIDGAAVHLSAADAQALDAAVDAWAPAP